MNIYLALNLRYGFAGVSGFGFRVFVGISWFVFLGFLFFTVF